MPNDPLTGENIAGMRWDQLVNELAPTPGARDPVPPAPMPEAALAVNQPPPAGPVRTPVDLQQESNAMQQMAQDAAPAAEANFRIPSYGVSDPKDPREYTGEGQRELAGEQAAQPFIDRLAWIEWQKDAATAKARGTDIPPFPTGLGDPASPYARITNGLKNASERAEFRRLLAAAQVSNRFVDPDKVTGIDTVTRMRYAKGEAIADPQPRLRFDDDTGNTREMVSLDEYASHLTTEYFARSLAAVATIGTSELYFGPNRRSFDEYIADDRPGIRWTAGALEQAANFLPSAPGNILFDAVRHGAFRLASGGASQQIGKVLVRAGAADAAAQIPREVLNHIDDLLYRNGGMITKEGAVAVPAGMEVSEREVLRNRLKQVADQVRQTKPDFKLRLTTTAKPPVSAGATVGTWMLGGAAAQVPLAVGDVVAAIPEGSEAVKAAAGRAPFTIGMGAGFAGALGKVLGPKPPTGVVRRILGDLHPPKNGVSASAYKLVLPRVGGQNAEAFDQAISRLEEATLVARDPRAARTFNDLWREHIDFVHDAKEHPSLAAQVGEREQRLLKRINLLADSVGLDVDTLHGAPISDVLYSPTMVSALPDTSWEDRLLETLSSQPRKSLGFDPLRVRVGDIGSDDPRVRALALDDGLAGQKNIPVGNLIAGKESALRTGDPKVVQVFGGDGRLYAKIEGQLIDVTDSTAGLDLPGDAEWTFDVEPTSPVDYILDDTGRLVPDVDGTLARDPQRQLLRRRFAQTEGEVDSPIKLFDDMNKANPSTSEQFESFAPRVAALEQQITEAHSRAFDEARNLVNPDEPFWRVHQLQASLLEDVYHQRSILEAVKERLSGVVDDQRVFESPRKSKGFVVVPQEVWQETERLANAGEKRNAAVRKSFSYQKYAIGRDQIRAKIESRLRLKKAFGNDTNWTPDQQENATRFLDTFVSDDILNDVGVLFENTPNAAGTYGPAKISWPDPVEKVVKYLTGVVRIGNESAAADETLIHELWHHLSRYLPNSLKKQIVRDLARYRQRAIKELPWLAKLFEEDGLRWEPKRFASLEDMPPESRSYARFDSATKTYRVELNDLNLYELTNPDEFFAVGLTKKVPQYFDELDQRTQGIFGHLARMLRKVKNFFGGLVGRRPLDRSLDLVAESPDKLQRYAGQMLSDYKDESFFDTLSPIDRIKALFDKARSKKKQGMAHEAPTKLRKDFRSRGYGHVKLDEFLEEAAKSGTLNQNEGALLREVFMDTEDSMLDSMNYGLTKKRNLRGAAIYDTRQLLIKKGLSRDHAQAASTFLHEYAHLASKSLLDPSEWDLVKDVWKALGRRGRLDYFRQGLLDGNASYYAKTPDEFFVQAFAEYVITKKAQDAKLLPVLQRVYTLMTSAFERLLRRQQPSQVRQLEPLFNMMLAGERAAPSMATRTRAISMVGQPGMTSEMFAALASHERKDHMIMRLNGMLSEHKPSKFSHLGGGNYRAILAHLRSARPSYDESGAVQNVSYARGWVPTQAERQEMSSAYEAALTEITKAQVGLMKLKKESPLTVPELVAVIDQLARVGPDYFTSEQFATLMKTMSPTEAWYKLERNFGDLKQYLDPVDIDKANLAREVGHKALSEAGARAIVRAQEDARFTYTARFINALDKTMMTLNQMGRMFMRPHTVVGPGKSLQQPDDLFFLRGSLNKNPYWLIRGSETSGIIGMHRFVNEQTLKLDPLIDLLRKDNLLNSSVVNALNSDLDNPIPSWKTPVKITKAQAMALGLNPNTKEADVHTIAKFFRGWFDPILKKTEAAIIEVDHGNVAKLKKQQEWLIGVMKTEAEMVDPASPWTEIAKIGDNATTEDVLDLLKRLKSQQPDSGSQALHQAVNIYDKIQEGVDGLYANIKRIEEGVLHRKNYVTRIYDNFSRDIEYDIRDPHNVYGRDMSKVYTKYIQPRSGKDARTPVANLPVIIGFYLPAMAKKIYLEPVLLRTEDMIDQLPDFYRNYINDWKKAIGGRLSPLEQTLSGQVAHDIRTGGTALPERLAKAPKTTPEKVMLRAGQVGNVLTSATQNFLMIQSMGLIHPANLAMLNALEYSWIPVQMAAQGPRAWARSHGSMLVGAAKGARDLAMDNPVANGIRSSLGMSPWMSKPRMAGSGEAFHELAENNLRQVVKQAGGSGAQAGQLLQTAYKLHFWSQVMVDQHERMTAWWTFRDSAIRSGLAESAAETWAKYQVDRVYGDLGKIGQSPFTKQGYGPIVTYLKRYLISKTDELAQDVKAALPQSPWVRAKPTTNPTGPGHSVAQRLADTIEQYPGDLNDYIPQHTVGGVSGRDLRQMGSHIADLPVNNARFKENAIPAFDERMRANEMFAQESGMRWEAFATKRAQKAAWNKLFFGYGGWLGEMALLSKLTGISMFKMLPWIANMGMAGLQTAVDAYTLATLKAKEMTGEPMTQYEAQQLKQLAESLPTRFLPFGSPLRLQRRMNKIAGVAPFEGYGWSTLLGEYIRLLTTKRGLGFVLKPSPTQKEIEALRGDPVR